MNENDFWHLIDAATTIQTHPANLSEAFEKLEELLANYERPELESFEKLLRENIQALFCPEIIELYIILENDFQEQSDRVIFNPYVSADRFLYFRCWLLLQGRDCCRAVIENPENILDHGVDIANTWGEDLLYVSDNAYGHRHANEDRFAIRDAVSLANPELDYDIGNYKIKSEGDHMELDRRYPQLVAAIRRLRG